ncbi:MAG: ADP-ribosylglycohydrolase family protein [Solirubrobacterales bacterium]
MLGTFVGDAIGMPFEGSPPRSFEPPLEMREGRLGRGAYTDDTQMMIALAESLLRNDIVEPADLRSSFLRAHEPRRGYGAGTEAVFRLWREGMDDAAPRVFADGSFGNGAAMRVAPIAVRFAFDDIVVESQAGQSASLTHAHPVGIDGAVAQAAAIAAALNSRSPLAAARAAIRTREFAAAFDLAAEACSAGPDPLRLADAMGATVASHQSVPVAILIAEAGLDFEESVTLAVACGGDTDTIAAMTGAIVGARVGERGIPNRWLAALENGPQGRDYVRALADRLAKRAARADTVAGPI